MAALDAWPAWHGGCLVLVGAEGIGKTHLAMGWAAQAGALILDRRATDASAANGRPVLMEDVDRGVDPETLFHLINMAGHDGGSLLLTARLAPAACDGLVASNSAPQTAKTPETIVHNVFMASPCFGRGRPPHPEVVAEAVFPEGILRCTLEMNPPPGHVGLDP